MISSIQPHENRRGQLCFLCDGTSEHSHPQGRCTVCGISGLSENMTKHVCRVTSMASLDFSHLRARNIERCETSFHPVNQWSPTDWACAMAGEAGEACNEIKKLKRETDGGLALFDCKDRLSAVAKELADVVCYLDLLAARLGIDLGQAVRDKFNEVSKRVGSTVKL